ncbi:MAG: ParB/RepB/Spo0J family partition protein [Alphaproteobacteria bacterium]
MSDDPKRRLGRGLSALLGDESADYASLEQVRGQRTVPVERLKPGKAQPRRHFADDDLADLVASVREKGILQPILVRRDPDGGDGWEIVAGERRWRAAQQAQLHEVPVVVREMSDRDALEIALIENLQRESLTPIEEAAAFQRLIDEYHHTQDVLAKSIGKSRSHVANTLRLLSLPTEVRGLVDTGKLSAGHARALIGTDDPAALAREVVAKGLNVRQVEDLVRRSREPAATAKAARRAAPAGKDADTLALERSLAALLGLKVEVRLHGKGAQGGSLVIHYDTLDQLDDVLQRLNGDRRPQVRG